MVTTLSARSGAVFLKVAVGMLFQVMPGRREQQAPKSGVNNFTRMCNYRKISTQVLANEHYVQLRPDAVQLTSS